MNPKFVKMMVFSTNVLGGLTKLPNVKHRDNVAYILKGIELIYWQRASRRILFRLFLIMFHMKGFYRYKSIVIIELIVAT